MRLLPYLFFAGTCEEAFNLYERALGGKIDTMMRYSDAPEPAPVPDDWGDKIMHVTMTVGDQVLMASDTAQANPQQGFAVSLQVDTPAEADRIFHALEDRATVTMPIGETFWAARFGMLTDRFGVPWMVNCDNPA